MGTSHVIIGDGIAGSSAAETIREADPAADITVLTEEGEALYNRILIKEFAKGKMPEGPISIHQPDWYRERDIELRLNTMVTRVDTDEQVIHTHEEEAIEYDTLLVATGGTPAQLPVENSDADGIHHFWTFEDARAIEEHADNADTGVIVGAGLLGIDLAAICGAQDVSAHYLMRGNTWWRYALSEDGAEIMHNAMREQDVTPVFESGVDRFEVDADGHVTGVVDPNGERYDADFVGVAIGLDFNTEFLRGSGIELTDNGAIVTDEQMRTNVENVYAAGDVTYFYDTILGEQAQNGAWGSAKEQGSIAATNMVRDTGEDVEEATFHWVSSYSITHFDFPFLSFGHPTIGDDFVERKYSETEWRRVVLKDGQVIGGVLIGDLAPQTSLKRLAREGVDVSDRTDALLEQTIDVEKFTPPEAEQ
ncbi:NAD(P)/FAD-dependent oxidoreductase [Halocatena salina]|uniref:FAD-dependent oxidoreductase n=1 Tax=Halocatena salina TaxID=2934340 RepID=A0A8U0A3T5_9EURY|nr:FAD-dependent oxidoreductase [Halocatena salina]UPM43469.1 FAD-dependent oxidoreductase [Halocatena salina]